MLLKLKRYSHKIKRITKARIIYRENNFDGKMTSATK